MLKKITLFAAAFAVLLAMGIAIRARADANAPVIKITAKQFGFTPNLVTLKRGQTVVLELTSEDVTHGFFSKPLGIDEIIAPGQPTRVTLTPQTAGKFTTICDHFCGVRHGDMKMTIMVEE